MLPSIQNQGIQPTLASYLPQLASAFSSAAARSHTADRVGETARPIMQINYGLINIPTVGSHNEINVHYHSTGSDAQLLREILRPIQSMALQSKSVPLAHLGIEQLQSRYLEGLEKDNEIKDALAMYVGLECTSIVNKEQRLSLEEKVKDFLASEEKKVLLLLGEAGSGKSTFNRYLARSLWQAYDNKADQSSQTPIPLFIPLASLKEPNSNLISEYLKKENFSDTQIAELKQNHRFIFILDGYDEIKDRTRRFYVENELDQWQAKVIISSRPEYLGDRYERQFHPKNQAHLLQGYQLAALSNLTIDEYIAKYKNAYPELAKSIVEHGEILEQPEVKDMIRNPFLLKMTLSELPELSKKYKEDGQRITRLALYEQFVESWFKRSQDRLSDIRLTDAEQKAFHFLNKAFTKHGTKFSQDFALAMYRAGKVSVTYLEPLSYDSSDVAARDWRDKFLSGSNEQIKLLRFNAPLICRDDQYQFIHKSIQDYLVARTVWEELKNPAESSRHIAPLNWNVQRLWEELDPGLEVNHDALLNQFNLVEDATIQRFLVERVEQDGMLVKPLLAWIKASTKEKSVVQGSANAITILVKAGVQFHGMDLKNIRIPGADMSFGVFDSAQLQGADLNGVKLRQSWLQKANLSGAQMAGVQFGEWVYLEAESTVTSCAYSPDEKFCAMGLDNGVIRVYDTSSWTTIRTLTGHTSSVGSVVYSPSGSQIASGSRDKTVRLWNANSGAPGLTLTGHTDAVKSVVYSPSGSQIASGSLDKTVRLWDANSGAPGLTLTGHTSIVFSVVYSPSGAQIASGSLDKTVRLWDADSGAPGLTLTGHTDAVSSVVYSPSGAQIASGSLDTTVRLWDAPSGAPGLTLRGHTAAVWSVVYSPSGAQIASASDDWTVRLWDANSSAPSLTLTGHTDAVKSVVYSPSGSQIASGSWDKTVRLWDANRGAPGLTLRGHTDYVWSVVYSPNGSQIASGSFDTTVRLWDANRGAPGLTLRGHTSIVYSVVYSPSGAQIASGSKDKTVRLWDAQSGAPGLTLTGHTDAVSSVVYSPSGAQIASASDDKTVRLWDAPSGAPSLTLRGHTGSVSSVVYSPSGAQIASASDDKTVRLWNANSGAPGLTLRGHTAPVGSVVYSPSGAQIASGSRDKTVRLWNANSGAPGLTLRGHTGAVRSVVYSPSGAQIASGSLDTTVRLWDIVSGECLSVIQGFRSAVWSVAWKATDNTQYLMGGSADKSVRQWELAKDAEGYKVSLCWSTWHEELNVVDTVIEGAEGLSEMNRALLKQRGANDGVLSSESDEEGEEEYDSYSE